MFRAKQYMLLGLSDTKDEDAMIRRDAGNFHPNHIGSYLRRNVSLATLLFDPHVPQKWTH